ncbi:MAG: hypothetical protein Q8N51_00705 [Gammaproteobacteria bacterium]|nr:hypothetical protein [Gammaproteobacteria bacterium]
MSDTLRYFIAGALILFLISQCNSSRQVEPPSAAKTSATESRPETPEQLEAARLGDEKLAAAEAEIARQKRESAQRSHAEEAVSGPRPGEHDALGAVESYLRRTANDPGSVEIQRCAKPFSGRTGWATLCDFRAKNGFGALVLQRWLFVIRNGQVVDAAQMPE